MPLEPAAASEPAAIVAPPVAPEPPVVAILAGGLGRRLGGSKPATALAGRPLISYPLASARAARLETVVVAKQSTQLPDLDAAVIYDRSAMVHPLSGVLAALAEHPAVIALACDMPFVPAALLRLLASCPEAAAVARPSDFFQPFPGLYRTACLPVLRAALAAERSMQKTLSSLHPRILSADDLAPLGAVAQIFTSVNTPADLEAAEATLRGSAAPGDPPAPNPGTTT